MVHKRDNKELEILEFLCKSDAHIRELEREIKIPHATLIRKLGKLEKQNIVDYKIVGKNKEYFIKRNLKARKMLEVMENYKLLKLLEKYPHLEPLFSDVIKKASSKMIILFGSYAKGTPKSGSDIDLYMEIEDVKMKKEVEEIHSRLSIKIGKFNQDSLLVKEIIKNHVILKGVERFYEQVFN